MGDIESILKRTVQEGECLVLRTLYKKNRKKKVHFYPSIRFNGKIWRGNRLVYSLVHNLDLGKNLVLHTCDNPRCLNPEHLYLGDHKQNMRDKISRNRDHNKVKTHCKNGHEFSGDNLIIRKTGARSCRICMRKYWNKFDKINREVRRENALARYYKNKEGKV